jgi:hypothetical protein
MTDETTDKQMVSSNVLVLELKAITLSPRSTPVKKGTET